MNFEALIMRFGVFVLSQAPDRVAVGEVLRAGLRQGASPDGLLRCQRCADLRRARRCLASSDIRIGIGVLVTLRRERGNLLRQSNELGMARYLGQVVSPEDGLVARKDELPGLERVAGGGYVVVIQRRTSSLDGRPGARWSAWRMG
ncbi:MAG TPA: hypothetical protein VMR52_02825 [Dehalococcoidia bacterium]|nr:hypothetical protein [Dehalococcoidia bacterium]